MGYKVALVSGCIQRHDSNGGFDYSDFIALDSAYDYDPFWQKCLDLKVAVVTHELGVTGPSGSPSNFVFNHIGRFSNAHRLFCKALILGGALRRFPSLRMGFLEGGVSWATDLYANLITHYKGRNVDAVTKCDPSRLDRDELVELFARYGRGLDQGMLDQVRLYLHPIGDTPPTAPLPPDDFALSGIKNAEEFREIFEGRFFFGCEADDQFVPSAFDGKLPFGARLNPVFSSDISHWDTPDITAVVAEAYELVEDGLLSGEQFKSYAFGNAVSLYAGANQDFFRGTAVESEARRWLEGTR